RLPGQQYDEESGLHYNRHRYYSPGQGRYITQDPVGLAGGWNPYQHPLNPIHKVDPLGLNGVDFGEEPFDAEDDMREHSLGRMDDDIFSIFPGRIVGEHIDIYEIAPFGISCFGNKGGPSGIRNRDLEPNDKGLLPSLQGVKQPRGKSLTRTPRESGLKGHYHTMPTDTKMPDGLGIIHDGRDVPGGYMSRGHSTVFPARDMTPDEFNKLLTSFPWEYGGKQ
ncbi:RHS repeat-associated core domain-containing protein, partial [Salmonella enterica]|uniref:RHS repeat-associated core domain-containing protein n=1 Tax=Salmonella enterica TaxID=28901 RepID=UPI0015C44E09